MIKIKKREIWDCLLGKYEPEKENNFLAACFSGDQTAEKYESARDDLIVSYLRGQLSADDSLQFKNHFLKDPQNSDLFFIAKNFREQLAQNKQLEVMVTGTSKKKLSGRFLIPALSFGALLLGGLMVWKFLITESPVIVINQPTPQPTLAARITPTAAVSVTPNNSPLPVTSPTTKPDDSPKPSVSPTPSTKKPNQTIVAFLLPIGSKGAAGDDVLVIKKTSKTVALETDQPSGFPKYAVTIRKDGEATVWTKTLELTNMNQDGFMVLSVPADIFKDGIYRYSITGINADGTTEKLPGNDRTFRVKVEK